MWVGGEIKGHEWRCCCCCCFGAADYFMLLLLLMAATTPKDMMKDTLTIYKVATVPPPCSQPVVAEV